MIKEGGRIQSAGMHFIRTKFQDMEGNTIIAYSEDSGTSNPFEVRITKRGMTFKGELTGFISTEGEVQDWAQFMGEWVKDVRVLRPNLSRSADPVV